MPSGDSAQDPAPARSILLLSDTWSSISDGISGVNKSLALSLARYKGIRLYNAILTPASQLSPSDRKEVEDNQITLISLAKPGMTIKDMYSKLEESPESFMDDIKKQVPFVHQIVGHAPVTAEAAIKLRESVYPDAKVVLFFHMIPHEADWLQEQLPYTVPSDTQLVQLGEKADVVYSVTEKLHWFNTAKFRNRATAPVDHRLFLPQCCEAVFSINRRTHSSRQPTILVVGDGGGAQDWLGLDIAVCAVNKVANASMEDSTTRPLPQLIIGGIAEDQVTEVKDKLSTLIDHPQLKLEVHIYKNQADFYKDLSECSMCLVPSRSEPSGYMGLHALSAGIPTLLAEGSALAPLVKRLTLEPDNFLVPVTPATTSVRQDASLWRDRIITLLQDMDNAHERAMQLRTALRRDEDTKESHDNFASFCLGGIRLKHEAISVEFLFHKDEEKELPVVRSVNKFVLAAMKQCWRIKHHPLTKDHDLAQIIPGLDLPIQDLRTNVTDKIEEYDRRIVGIDQESGAFIVYCPTLDALSDLWAMCDRINQALTTRLLYKDENPVLEAFRLRGVTLRTIISGPEFLKYKEDLISTGSAS